MGNCCSTSDAADGSDLKKKKSKLREEAYEKKDEVVVETNSDERGTPTMKPGGDLLPAGAGAGAGSLERDGMTDEEDRVPTPPAPAPPRPLDPEEEETRRRRAELMEEMTAPKIIDFGDLDIVVDDDDHTGANVADAEAVIQAFNQDFEHRSPESAARNRERGDIEEGSGNHKSADGEEEKASSTPGPGGSPSETIPTDTWFQGNGLSLPKLTWYQTKDRAFLSIAPGECDAGWDVQGSVLSFVAYGSEDCVNADMSFFDMCGRSNFEARGECLDITIFKKVPMFWPQLFKCSRKTMSDVSWLKRDLSKEEDDDDDEEEETEEDEEDEEEEAHQYQ